MAKLSDPLSFRFVKKGARIPVESMDYPDLDVGFLSGYLDSVSRKEVWCFSTAIFQKTREYRLTGMHIEDLNKEWKMLLHRSLDTRYEALQEDGQNSNPLFWRSRRKRHEKQLVVFVPPGQWQSPRKNSSNLHSIISSLAPPQHI